MFYQIELFLLGVATVFDTVLLLIVLERVNRAQVASWLYALLFGLWLIHGASFAHELLREVVGSNWIGPVLVWLTCAGLLVIPSAMLHAALWLNIGRTEHQWRYVWLYLPMVLLGWIAAHLMTTEVSSFLQAVEPVAGIYLSGVVVCNLMSMGLFFRVRHRVAAAGADRFFTRLALWLAWMTAVLIGYYNVIDNPVWEPMTRVVLILSPLLPAGLFVWHTLNQRLLPLVLERTLLYGAAVVVLLFLHRLLIEPIATSLQAHAQVDILMIEGWLLIALVIAWPPLRGRFREAVRYLLSSNVHQIREATRRLSVEMSQLTWHSADDLAQWMADALRRAIDVDAVTIVLVASSEARKNERAVELNHDFVLSCWSSPGTPSGISQTVEVRAERAHLHAIYESLGAESQPYIFRGQILASEVEQAMLQLGTLWAFRMHFRTVRGMVLVGPRLRNDRLADEQLVSLSLLIEQFAATLHNRQLEQLRLRAERHAMQQEKLSMLGLLSGTLSHELRNPLSSMRTIAQLMLEDMGACSPHARDVTMILGEIDRLTQTTTRLLDFSRPASDQSDTVCPDRIITRLLAMLEHLARLQSVTLEVKLTCGECRIASSDASLSEILFNLIKNAIEAASSPSNGQGEVVVHTQMVSDTFVCTVSDNGPGMTEEFQSTMFEPFVTAKPDGTGLGLFIVGQRVTELQGSIRCTSQPGRGTSFEVRLAACGLSKQAARFSLRPE